MITYQLKFKLKSDATFGRGEGVAGLIDQEVEHDAAGLPYLRGRTLKGLLNEECANILFALREQDKAAKGDRWHEAARRLWGQQGTVFDDKKTIMRIGAAQLPRDLHELIHNEVNRGELDRVAVLESLTAIRRQTAVDEQRGTPVDGSLRSMRVVLRKMTFVAELGFTEKPSDNDLMLLAATVLAWRRGGTGRNRGRGRVEATLYDEDDNDITQDWFKKFMEEVNGA